MNKKILLVGGGGHCKSVLDSLLNTNQYSEIGVIDKNELIGKKVLSVTIIGSDEDLTRLYREGYKYAFVTVGSIGDPNIRIKLFNTLENIGFKIPNIIDTSAILSDHVKLDNGIFVGKKAVINTGSYIRKGTIINTSTIIEHDCIIEEFSHIAPGAVLCGEVRVGVNTHIGANSVIRQQVSIGSNAMIGIGSVVLNNIENGMVAYGNPCKGGQPQ